MGMSRGWVRRFVDCTEGAMRTLTHWFGLDGRAVHDVEEVTMGPVQPPLPAMAVLADGRFALRVAVRVPNGVSFLWEVRRLRPAATEDDPSTGWLVDGYLDNDAEVVAAGGRSVEPLVDVVLLADELEAAGQFASARLVRERATLVRHTGAGS